jgi:hypothetical protein
MLRVLTVMAAVAGGGLCVGIASQDAAAVPSPTLSGPVATPTAAATVQYYTRRQWRRRGPVVVVPNTAVAVDPDVEVGVDDLPEGSLNPPVIAIVPVRPSSCGQYRYWNGNRCVDARYNDPYLGPR